VYTDEEEKEIEFCYVVTQFLNPMAFEEDEFNSYLEILIKITEIEYPHLLKDIDKFKREVFFHWKAYRDGSFWPDGKPRWEEAKNPKIMDEKYKYLCTKKANNVISFNKSVQ
jgi:hypothetical protein